MKNIKLFDQFEEGEDWWNEESPFDPQTKLRVIKGGSQYYLLKEIIGDQIRLFDERNYTYDKELFKMNPYWDKDKEKITIITDDGLGRGNSTWAEYLYKDLPKEVRDKIELRKNYRF